MHEFLGNSHRGNTNEFSLSCVKINVTLMQYVNAATCYGNIATVVSGSPTGWKMPFHIAMHCFLELVSNVTLARL